MDFVKDNVGSLKLVGFVLRDYLNVQCFSYLNSMIAMIRYVDLSAFVHTHASWVPDLPFRFSPRAELEQKATTGIKNLAEEYR